MKSAYALTNEKRGEFSLKRLHLHIFVSFLVVCSTTHGAPLPYEAWRLGFSAPDYMEAWIETADVVDTQRQVYHRAMSGVAAIQTPPHNSGDPKGWPKKTGPGQGKVRNRRRSPQKNLRPMAVLG